MARPQYTWYLDSNESGATEASGGAWLSILLTPVGSDAGVGTPLWYVTPVIPNAKPDYDEPDYDKLRVAQPGWYAASTTAHLPWFVDEGGVFYGTVSKDSPHYEWGFSTPFPAMLWRTDPIPYASAPDGPTAPAGELLHSELVYIPTPPDTEAQRGRLWWMSHVYWDAGAVLEISCAIEWYSQAASRWYAAVATDDVRESGRVRRTDVQDQREGAGNFFSGGSVTFADGRRAAMFAASSVAD